MGKASGFGDCVSLISKQFLIATCQSDPLRGSFGIRKAGPFGDECSGLPKQEGARGIGNKITAERQFLALARVLQSP
jgi:hypothetical protein